ncbi:MAG TPA: endonuclease domain-containing protein [Longimicrobium sp.]|nr:endonuclease domain-containing protein [Longimicrobium sp.]
MPQKKRARIIPRVMHAARGHRTVPTEAEERLWDAVRGQQIRGLQFRRQHPFHSFILDFYCPKKKLCIELDGPIHDGREMMDTARTEALKTRKIRVIRFRNEEVLNDLPSVLARIEAALDAPE